MCSCVVCVSLYFTMLLVTVAALLLSTVDETRGTYLHLSQIDGALATYKTIASWDEAKQKCQDDGAVLASPITETLQKELQKLFKNTFHFIGLDARFQQNTFVSVEGVRLEEMPLTDMYDRLDLDLGQCLSMNHREIRVVQCTERMPYVCFKNETYHSSKQTVDEITTTGCMTKGYKYYKLTDSCYKIYKDTKSWDDASATCQADHGHLLVIDNDREMQVIKQIVESEVYHIGLRDWSQNGDWKSVTGKSIAEIYNVWLFTNTYKHEDCAVLLFWDRIDDSDCSKKRFFICEL